MQLLKFSIISIVEVKEKIVDVGILTFLPDFTILDENEILTTVPWIDDKGVYSEEEALKLLINLVDGNYLICWDDFGYLLEKFKMSLGSKILLKEKMPNIEMKQTRAYLRCREMYVAMRNYAESTGNNITARLFAN